MKASLRGVFAYMDKCSIERRTPCVSVSQARPVGSQVPFAVPLGESARLSARAVDLAPSQR